MTDWKAVAEWLAKFIEDKGEEIGEKYDGVVGACQFCPKGCKCISEHCYENILEYAKEQVNETK